MFPVFLENFSKELSGQWLERLFGPAFLFWGGGLLLWIGPSNLSAQWDAWVALPLVTQAALLIGALLILVTSDRLAEAFSFYALRVLEGYWPGPLRLLARWRIRRRQKRVQKLRQLRSDLMLKHEEGTLSTAERQNLAHLETMLRYTPRDPDDLMPTELGDILRTAETRPRHRYGLDPVLLWPHLWLLLPETARTELTAMRVRLDRAAQLWLWGVLFFIWSLALGLGDCLGLNEPCL